MSSKVKLTVKVTGDSSAEFDAVVTATADGFVASAIGLGLTADGATAQRALQGLVQLIQNNGADPVIQTIEYGV